VTAADVLDTLDVNVQSGAVDLANADATTNTNKANGARLTARL
jgi:hypothetical protein